MLVSKYLNMQQWKRVIFVSAVGSVLFTLYATSETFIRWPMHNIKLWSSNREYFDNVELASNFHLPKELLAKYKNTTKRGIIRSQDDLPFNISCLKALDKINFDNLTHYNKEDLTNKDIKKILVWHQDYPPCDLGFGQGRGGFERSCCLENRCFITDKRTLMPMKDYDAIILHYRGLNPNDLPHQRWKHQRWIFSELESGSNMGQNPSIYKNFFNWTMSYRRDSDIYSSYGQVVSNKLLPSSNHNVTVRNYAAGKTKLVAWFVSNCRSASNREAFVQSLEQYLKDKQENMQVTIFQSAFSPNLYRRKRTLKNGGIDIYGYCGTQECSRKNESKCLNMLGTTYKFYFSFENSLCKDYATEKLYRILKYDVVAVVYGFADYEAIAPPHSYINAMSFNTSKDLADYLLYLNNNDTAYNEYFSWKDHYHVYDKTLPFNLCELCYKLHNDNKTKIYEDIGHWYKSEGHCRRLLPVSWVDWAFG